MNNLVGRFNLYLLTEKCASINTVEAYSRDIDQFREFCRKHKCNLNTITIEIIKVFLKELYDAGLSTATRARKISAVKSFVLYSNEDHEIIPHLVCPRIEKSIPEYLNEKEMRVFLKAAHKAKGFYALRNRLVLYLLYATGMRVSELTSLRMKNINIHARTIIIDGKGSKQRMIPLLALLVPTLQEYLSKYHSKFGTQQKPYEWLFPVQYGVRVAPMSRQNVMVVIKNLFKKTKINKNISPHSIRHTFATHLINRGVNLRHLQLLLGHEHIASTEVYTHVDISHKRKIYDQKHPRA